MTSQWWTRKKRRTRRRSEGMRYKISKDHRQIWPLACFASILFSLRCDIRYSMLSCIGSGITWRAQRANTIWIRYRILLRQNSTSMALSPWIQSFKSIVIIPHLTIAKTCWRNWIWNAIDCVASQACHPKNFTLMVIITDSRSRMKFNAF